MMINPLKHIRLKRFDFEKNLPALHFIFMKIAEPRVLRLIQFVVYLAMVAAGIGILFHPPAPFTTLIGLTLTYVFGSFITIGALMGAGAVLPGVWWLERVGIIALVWGLLMYVVLVISLGSSPIGVAVSVAFIGTFIQRFLEIKGAQLAPKKG